MKKDIHPGIALLVIVVAVGAVLYLYTQVFHGRKAGSVGGPASGPAMHAPPPGMAPPGSPEWRKQQGLPPLNAGGAAGGAAGPGKPKTGAPGAANAKPDSKP